MFIWKISIINGNNVSIVIVANTIDNVCYEIEKTTRNVQDFTLQRSKFQISEYDGNQTVQFLPPASMKLVNDLYQNVEIIEKNKEIEKLQKEIKDIRVNSVKSFQSQVKQKVPLENLHVRVYPPMY